MEEMCSNGFAGQVLTDTGVTVVWCDIIRFSVAQMIILATKVRLAFLENKGWHILTKFIFLISGLSCEMCVFPVKRVLIFLLKS
jgi:hypothetical protein